MRAIRAPFAVIGIAGLLCLGCCLVGQLGAVDLPDQPAETESGAAGGMTAPYSATLAPLHKVTERLLPAAPAAAPRLGLSSHTSEIIAHGPIGSERSSRTSLFLTHCSFLC